jgi:hypothetical protein
MEKEGMSKKEIAVKLGVAQTKINQFLTAFQDLPEKFRKDVVSGDQGVKPGEIASHTAAIILNLKKSNLIKAPQAESLLKKVKQKKLDLHEIQKISTNIRKGESYKDVVNFFEKTRHINVRVLMNDNDYQRLFKDKNGVAEGIRQIIYGEKKTPLKRPSVVLN